MNPEKGYNGTSIFGKCFNELAIHMYKSPTTSQFGHVPFGNDDQGIKAGGITVSSSPFFPHLLASMPKVIRIVNTALVSPFKCPITDESMRRRLAPRTPRAPDITIADNPFHHTKELVGKRPATDPFSGVSAKMSIIPNVEAETGIVILHPDRVSEEVNYLWFHERPDHFLRVEDWRQYCQHPKSRSDGHVHPKSLALPILLRRLEPSGKNKVPVVRCLFCRKSYSNSGSNGRGQVRRHILNHHWLVLTSVRITLDDGATHDLGSSKQNPSTLVPRASRPPRVPRVPPKITRHIDMDPDPTRLPHIGRTIYSILPPPETVLEAPLSVNEPCLSASPLVILEDNFLGIGENSSLNLNYDFTEDMEMLDPRELLVDL